MVKYLGKRIARSFLTLAIILTAVFCLLRFMPIEGYFQNFDKMTSQQIQVGLKEMGLSDPLPVQIIGFFADLFHGDLGVSRIYRANVPVSDILADKIPVSIKLGGWSMVVSLLIGLPLGALMARFQHGLADRIGTLFIVCIQAVPATVYFLYIQLYGTSILKVGLLFQIDDPRYWILPILSMSLGNIAFYGMWLRRYMVDESNRDYVKLAKAKGLSENQIIVRHMFRNAFVPLVQYIPTAFLNTVIGSIYIESLYSIPGMGGLLVTVIKKHDNTMVQGIVLLYACVGVLGLLIGDVLMVMLDPRISLGRKEGDR
ncbi:ABC transporter permease [Clostridium sp. HBUAS56010]|uniref:ABC transporter permease n=1 Tax=Clostridium sp. HBUAS56010 TaxID=2571127 RepID=UPI0011773A0C|nr:ABC transporter permease [Clostridium sp. HBUAS56010]